MKSDFSQAPELLGDLESRKQDFYYVLFDFAVSSQALGPGGQDSYAVPVHIPMVTEVALPPVYAQHSFTWDGLRWFLEIYPSKSFTGVLILSITYALCFLHINPTWYRCSVFFSFFTLQGEPFIREILYFFDDWHGIKLHVAMYTEAKSSSILQGFPLHSYIAK